jgi:uncharacterized protein (TIRG00374 family)
VSADVSLTEDKPSGRPAWARWVTVIALVIAAFALVFTIRSTGISALAKSFEQIGWWWFGVVALEVTVTTLDAVAIRAFLSPETDRVRLRTALLAQLAGRAVNAVTPTGNLGEAVKVSVLVEKVSQSRAVACILLYNVVGFTVELAVVAIAAPLMVLLMPMSGELKGFLLLAGAISLIVALALYFLVRRGVLTSVASALVRIRLVSPERYERWKPRLLAVDDKMKRTNAVRTRDRVAGVIAMTLSRATSMTISMLLLRALGEPITVKFVAAFTVGGFAIYMIGSLVPMGLGISEGGYYELFRALGDSSERGVAVTLARRATVLVYAAIGLVLMTASETVRRARDRHKLAVPAAPQAPVATLPTLPTLPVAQQISAPPVVDAK